MAIRSPRFGAMGQGDASFWWLTGRALGLASQRVLQAY